MIRLAVISSVLTTILMAGCTREKEAPPQFNYGMSSEGGQPLMPLTLKEQDKRLIEQAAATPEPAAPAGGTPTPVADTPQTVAQRYVQAWASGNLDGVAELLTAEQREAFRGVIETLQPLASSVVALYQAVQERFPGNAIQITLDRTSLELLLNQIRIESVTSVDDNNAEIQLQDASGQVRLTLTARRVEGKWQVDDSRLADVIPAGDDQLKEQLAKLATDLEPLATQIRDPQIADIQAAVNAVQKVVSAVGGSASAVQVQPASENEQPENTGTPAVKTTN